MKKLILVAALLFSLALGLAGFTSVEAKGVHAGGTTKVELCHVGTEEVTDPVTGEVTEVTTFETIVVGAPAADSHIANHGDTLGPCPEVALA